MMLIARLLCACDQQAVEILSPREQDTSRDGECGQSYYYNFPCGESGGTILCEDDRKRCTDGDSCA